LRARVSDRNSFDTPLRRASGDLLRDPSPSEWPATEKRCGRKGQHVLGHPVSMDLIAAAPTQNDHVVDPRGGFAIGSRGPSFNGLHTDAVPVVVEFQ
jgi:hypothetical protein